MVDKCVFNAHGKLYRYDPKSNDITYQYTKRLISIIENLDINQMISLINIDVNYVLPYIVPVYNDNTDIRDKEKTIVDCDFRCLNLFKAYYGEDIYNKYYKVINKIYNDYLVNINSYDFSSDYNSLFDLFKILFIICLIYLFIYFKLDNKSLIKPTWDEFTNDFLNYIKPKSKSEKLFYTKEDIKENLQSYNVIIAHTKYLGFIPIEEFEYYLLAD